MSILHLPFLTIFASALVYFLALIVIVFVHEFGHFYVGRLCGVKVETFSIGFGKEIFGFFDKHGTRWKFSWIPMGGYVKFAGDANAASLPNFSAEPMPGSLQAATLWKRMAVVIAGPAANFILAIAIFTVAFAWFGTQVAEPRVDNVTDDGAAKIAGLKAGDFIRKIDGQKITSFFDIQEAMILRGERPVALEVERGGSTLDIILTPRIKEVDDGFGSTQRTSLIGISHDFTKDPKESQRLSLTQAIGKSVGRTIFITQTTLRYLSKIIVGSERSNQLHGPLGVAKIAGDVAAQGIWPFITFIGFISVSIGLVNLFPIPMLDGGHLVFYIIEGLIGKPVSPQAQEWSFRIGISVILMLMIFVSINDIGRFAAMGFGT